MRAKVTVYPRREILDPQGKAIRTALQRVGFAEVTEVRAGKSFEIDLGPLEPPEAAARVGAMCEHLLANTVVEEYAIEIFADAGADGEKTSVKCGVVLFPGSNCDHDVYHVLKHVLEQDVVYLWHEETTLKGCDFIILPGGWSYGDYLRGGAMAALSPVMRSVREHAAKGGPVLGICNGFQVLTEARLLPGALRRNRGLKFECRDTFLKVERNDLVFTSCYRKGQVLRLPIAHGEGNYEHFPGELDRLEANRQIVFRYVSPAGELDDAWNFNGSARAIAGVVNEAGNVLGLMPHPERCAEEVLGNVDGLGLFQGIVQPAARLVGAAR